MPKSEERERWRAWSVARASERTQAGKGSDVGGGRRTLSTRPPSSLLPPRHRRGLSLMDDVKAELARVAAERAQIEATVAAASARLETAGVGMKTPLVDNEVWEKG